nr:unnamed protein product [Spirometra erinaceieuropaei]
MQAPTRISTIIVRNLLFADDCALNSTTARDMERGLDLFAADCANFGLTANTEKTVVMHQPLPNVVHNVLHTNVNGAQLRVADTSTCLSSTLSRSIKIEDEVGLQISKASQTFGRLQNTVWNHHDLHLNPILKMYKAIDLPHESAAFNTADHPEAYDCPITEQFAKAVADRVLDELGRPIYTPSTAGEAFLNSDFDVFENRFLKNSEYAILVVSGQQAICLDLVYGRLLVFLTLRPTWRERFILIYIGNPVGQKLFEPTIFQTEPLIFSESPSVWYTETEKWDKLLGILRTRNIRSLLNNPKSNRPERRTALLARELAAIATLSETRFSEQGQLEEVGAGYTFFWSGRPRSERRDAGVAFAIQNDIVGRLPCLPQGLNDRLMSLRLPLRRGGKFALIISAYAPPMTSPDAAT